MLDSGSANLRSIAWEHMAFSNNAVWRSKAKPYKADRFLFAAASRTGDSRKTHREIRTDNALCARRHLGGDFG